MDYENYNDYELLYMIKEDEGVFSIILKKYNPIIVHIAYDFFNKYKNYGVDVEDLVQEGKIAFFKACNSFSDRKNVIFYTYVILCIKRRLTNYIVANFLRNKNKVFCDYESLDDINCTQISDYSHPLDDLISYEMVAILKEFSYELNFIDSCIFTLKNNNFSYKEISSLLDISVKKVDNSLLLINKKLKKYLLDSKFCL